MVRRWDIVRCVDNHTLFAHHLPYSVASHHTPLVTRYALIPLTAVVLSVVPDVLRV
jgi:hypothetical protein